MPTAIGTISPFFLPSGRPLAEAQGDGERILALTEGRRRGERCRRASGCRGAAKALAMADGEVRPADPDLDPMVFFPAWGGSRSRANRRRRYRRQSLELAVEIAAKREGGAAGRPRQPRDAGARLGRPEVVRQGAHGIWPGAAELGAALGRRSHHRRDAVERHAESARAGSPLRTPRAGSVRSSRVGPRLVSLAVRAPRC